jgi:hypothetical protein
MSHAQRNHELRNYESSGEHCITSTPRTQAAGATPDPLRSSLLELQTLLRDPEELNTHVSPNRFRDEQQICGHYKRGSPCTRPLDGPVVPRSSQKNSASSLLPHFYAGGLVEVSLLAVSRMHIYDGREDPFFAQKYLFSGSSDLNPVTS